MLRDRAFGTKTAELAPQTSRDSLNNISLNRYRNYMARFNPNASYNRFDEAEFLEKLRITENGKCTYAGLLMFGKREVIEIHFADFRVDLWKFRAHPILMPNNAIHSVLKNRKTFGSIILNASTG
jgi:predicted HTH transcriptional regulator